MALISSRGQFGGGILNPNFGGGMGVNSTVNMGVGGETFGIPQNVRSTTTTKANTDWWSAYNAMLSKLGLPTQDYWGAAKGLVGRATGTAPSWQNVTADTVDAGKFADPTAAINAALPGIYEQENLGFANAAARAGRSGMTMSTPYATALGAVARKGGNDIASLTENMRYEAAKDMAARQLQAAISNQQANLQAGITNSRGALDTWQAGNEALLKGAGLLGGWAGDQATLDQNQLKMLQSLYSSAASSGAFGDPYSTSTMTWTQSANPADQAQLEGLRLELLRRGMNVNLQDLANAMRGSQYAGTQQIGPSPQGRSNQTMSEALQGQLLAEQARQAGYAGQQPLQTEWWQP